MSDPQLNDLKDEVFSGLKNFGRILVMLVLSVGFLGSGMLKLVGMPELIEEFTKWGFPMWFLYLVGAFELCLSIAIFFAPTRAKAALVTVAFMIAASSVHIYFGEFDRLIAPAVLISAAAILLYIEVAEKK